MSEPTPSIEQYRESLNMLSASFDDPGMEEFAPDVQLSHALDELAALRAQVAELEREKALKDTVLQETAGGFVDGLELVMLRAEVIEQRQWRARAEMLLRAIVDVRQHLSIDEARTLLGEGGL